MTEKKRPVSPINGQPLPQGHQWKSSEEAREAGKKGGVRSGEVRRARRTLREELAELLCEDITDKTGRTMKTQKAISTAMIKQALTGNTKAFEVIRDTIGEKPVEKVMISEVEQSVIDEVEAMVRGDAPAEPKEKKPDMTGKILKIEPETEKIICTYKTAAKAAKENGIDPSNLSKAIKSGRLLGGYKWQRRKD